MITKQLGLMRQLNLNQIHADEQSDEWALFCAAEIGNGALREVPRELFFKLPKDYVHGFNALPILSLVKH